MHWSCSLEDGVHHSVFGWQKPVSPNSLLYSQIMIIPSEGFLPTASGHPALYTAFPRGLRCHLSGSPSVIPEGNWCILPWKGYEHIEIILWNHGESEDQETYKTYKRIQQIDKCMRLRDENVFHHSRACKESFIWHHILVPQSEEKKASRISKNQPLFSVYIWSNPMVRFNIQLVESFLLNPSDCHHGLVQTYQTQDRTLSGRTWKIS